MPPSNEELTELPVTDVVETVALGAAAATTMPPMSGPPALITPTWPVMVLSEMVPPVRDPPVLCVTKTIPQLP